MSLESKVSFRGKVTLGSDKVLGMGSWSWSGYSRAMIEDVEFGDEADSFLYGRLKGGTLTFNGNYKKDDTQGQDILRSNLLAKGEITDIRFYVDETSYLTPNSTTAAGGGVPAGGAVSHVKVVSIDGPNFGEGDVLGKIGFSVQLCEGYMRLI